MRLLEVLSRMPTGSVILASMLVIVSTASESVAEPLASFPVPSSDALLIQEAGRVVNFLGFDQPPALEYVLAATFPDPTLLRKTVTLVPGLGDTVIRLTNGGTQPSDILAMKVTNHPSDASKRILEFNFWSDGAPISADAFLLQAGLQNPQVKDIKESPGSYQDVTSDLFPIATPVELEKVFLASPSPGSFFSGPIANPSDAACVQLRGQPCIGPLVFEGTTEFKVAFAKFPNVTFRRGGSLVRDTVVKFCEVRVRGPETPGETPDPGDLDCVTVFGPGAVLSDLFVTHVTGDCSVGCGIEFSFWSVDPSKSAATFLSDTNVDFFAALFPVVAPEFGHPPLINLLFPGIADDDIPFKTIFFSSDPPTVTQPATLYLLALGLVVAPLLSHRGKFFASYKGATRAHARDTRCVS